VVISKEPVAVNDLIQRFPQLFIDSIGDLGVTFSEVAAPASATSHSAVFLATPKALAEGLLSKAKVIIIGKKSRDEAAAVRGDRTVLIASHVELAMATVINAFFLATPYTNRAQNGIHPTAVIGDRTEIAPGVRIGPNAFIGANVKISSGCYIGANAVIEDQTTIGENSVIHPLSFIGHSTRIGKRCEVHPQSVIGKEGFGYAHDEQFQHTRIPHQGCVVLEDDVHIGSCVTIDRATFGETRIQAGARLDNQIQIAHNCRIGRNSLLTSGFSVAGSTTIGANFVAGGRSVATGHVNVCDNVQIAALSGIAKDITEPGQYGGVPLVPVQQHIRIKAAMVQLPEMRKQLNRIIRKLGLDSE